MHVDEVPCDLSPAQRLVADQFPRVGRPAPGTLAALTDRFDPADVLRAWDESVAAPMWDGAEVWGARRPATSLELLQRLRS